ncbi:MAG: hypothetical protein CMJ81_06315 [Planctomycetaceae bacterium]|nr:hypothetical protein [Planctomycetaceae bacterium]MBP60502.1 hypothetical protein [Planctomycetaceae bacterium]
MFASDLCECHAVTATRTLESPQMDQIQSKNIRFRSKTLASLHQLHFSRARTTQHSLPGTVYQLFQVTKVMFE